MKKRLIIFFLLLAGVAHAQKRSSRQLINFNQGWQFVKKDSATPPVGWEKIDLPHTWNVDDVMDDVPGYYRGVGWYRKTFSLRPEWKGKELSFYFEGANQETTVYINGKKAGQHIGGYTGFSIDAGSFLEWDGTNELLVKVDNSHNENIAPLTADFTFYGGIYRDVFLVARNKIHFNDDEGSSGVYLSTPSVSKALASVLARNMVSNQSAVSSKVSIVTTVLDKNGKRIAEAKSVVSVKAFSTLSVVQKIPAIKHPHLWSPEQPYLYSVETKIVSASGELLDLVKNPLGFRWFRFDADKGFFLNDKAYKLVGASRHQDYKGLGNAVPDSLAVKDMVLLKKMGANFLRVAHYPQDPSILRACDSLGLLASVEIPLVNEITESDVFYTNSENMLKEMIRQGYNHPSVVLWCYMNEVLLKPHFSNDKERQKIYFSNITQLAQRLEDLSRKEDPYRYTFMANHGNLEQYKKAGLLEIPMVIGWNLYSGWYGGNLNEFPKFLDEFHSSYPHTAFFVTEYGADADPRIRSEQPVRFDKSIEYTTRFHQYYLAEMLKRPFVAGAVVWNLADFNSETRSETMPHINNKGLLEWDRTPKDPYYFYEAMLSQQPFIKILGSCNKHFGIADSNRLICLVPVQVASNIDSVTIILNGQKQERLKINDGLCELRLPFKEGWNTVIAEGKKSGKLFRDSVSTEVHLQASCLTDTRFALRQMNIMLGSTRYYVDQKGEWWQPDQVYRKGYWGSSGGKKFRLQNNTRLPYGTDKNILGTYDDPVYQTQLTGIQQYRLDIPPGKYEVLLHFAELLGGVVRVPPYNLNEDERKEELKQRIFNVSINGRTMLDHFNIAKDYGLATPVVKTFNVTVSDDNGISIDFEPVEGEPVLNALQLRRISEDGQK